VTEKIGIVGTIRTLIWGGFRLAEVLGVLLWCSASWASAVSLYQSSIEKTIVSQQTSLEVAICRQQWQSAIDLATALIGIPQISPAQRQAYVDLRHRLETLQSRSQYPDFVFQIEDPHLSGAISADRCRLIQAKTQDLL